jgi:hypothetical protein
MLGWLRFSTRLAEASLHLLSGDFGHELTALRRSMTEHTMVILWVADSGEVAINALHKAHQTRIGKVHVAAAASNWALTAGVFDVTPKEALPGSPEETFLNLANLFRAFGSEAMEGAWLLDTGIAHPSMVSARYCLDRDPRLDGRPHIIQWTATMN